MSEITRAKILQALSCWPAAVFVWLLFSGSWKIALAGMAVMLVSPYLLNMFLLMGLILLSCANFLSFKKNISQSAVNFMLTVAAALSYLWIFIALWGYFVLKYTLVSAATGLWGIVIVMAPLEVLESSNFEAVNNYKRVAKGFSIAAFIVAFVLIKAFGGFSAPIIGTYAVFWFFWILASIFLMATFENHESQSENDADMERYFWDSDEDPDIEELDEEDEDEEDEDELDLDVEEIDEEPDIEEHTVDYFGVKMYRSQAASRKRGPGQKPWRSSS
jgi:hypothetical protein